MDTEIIDEGSANRIDAQTGQSAHDARASHRRVFFVLAAGALTLVSMHALGVGVDTIHVLGLVYSLNDQVVYVDAARHLLATGEMTTGLIYPSTLLQDFGRNYLYMPGHPTLIALSIATFGDSPMAAMLPNLVAHLLCLPCLYFTGRRLGNARAGFLAAFAFAWTPIFLVYAFSAMAEMTTLAACLVAFTLFVHLPSPMRAWVAPLLLLGPFLLRETSAFWIAPMLVVFLMGASEGTLVRRWRAAAIAFLGSVLMLGIVYRLDWIADRPSLWAQNLFGRTFMQKYTDAYSVSRLDMDAVTIGRATLEVGLRNLGDLFDVLSTVSFESMTLHALLWIPLGAGILAWRTPRLRVLVVAWAALAAITFVFVTLLYRWNGYIGVRQLLPPAMLGLLVIGGALDESLRKGSLRSIAIGAGAVWLASCALVVHQTGLVTENDVYEATIRDVLANTPITEGGVFVVHHDLGLVYLSAHPGSMVSFPPANRATLNVLEDRYDVRSALLQEAEIRRLTLYGLDAVGLRDTGSISQLRFFSETNGMGAPTPHAR